MTARRRNLLFAGLVLVAFVAAGIKVGGRAAQSSYAVAPVKTVPTAEKPLDGGPAQKLVARFVSSIAGQAVHAPSIAELSDGRLRAVWFSGSREGGGDVTVQTAVLNPASGVWGAESTLFGRQQLQRGLSRYVKKIGNPVIARAADGSLHLWMVNVSLGGWAGSAITWSRSADDGTSWSQPKRLVTSPFLNISTLVKGAPSAMVDGSASLPVYHEFITKFGEVLRITADGQVLDKIRIAGSHTSLQPVLLVNSGQEATTYLRAGQGGKVITSSTRDAGQSWAPARATRLVNPDSSVAGLVNSAGDQLLALNPTTAGRQSLAVLRSNSSGNFDSAKPLFIEGVDPAWDSGATDSRTAKTLSLADHAAQLGRELKASGAVDADIQAYVASAARQLCGPATCVQEFSYPFLLQTRDGNLHLVYTWNRSRIKHIRLAPNALN